jgi:hypothetical protein
MAQGKNPADEDHPFTMLDGNWRGFSGSGAWVELGACEGLQQS